MAKPQDNAVGEPPKKKTGRPTKYDPAMCETVIELGAKGASRAEIAMELGIHWDTFHEWQKQHPAFSDAIKRAMQLAQGWWEKKGREATFASEGFNATSYIFQMKNRFRDEWSDRVVNENTGTVKIEWGKPE